MMDNQLALLLANTLEYKVQYQLKEPPPAARKEAVAKAFKDWARNPLDNGKYDTLTGSLQAHRLLKMIKAAKPDVAVAVEKDGADIFLCVSIRTGLNFRDLRADKELDAMAPYVVLICALKPVLLHSARHAGPCEMVQAYFYQPTADADGLEIKTAF